MAMSWKPRQAPETVSTFWPHWWSLRSNRTFAATQLGRKTLIAMRTALLKYGQTNKNERKQKYGFLSLSEQVRKANRAGLSWPLPTSVGPRKASSRLYFSGTFNSTLNHYLSITSGLFLQYYFLINLCVYVSACHSTRMEVQRTTRGSFFPPRECWGSDSGRQLWRQAPLPAEPFLQPPIIHFEE